jgi:hypothetical protein
MRNNSFKGKSNYFKNHHSVEITITTGMTITILINKGISVLIKTNILELLRLSLITENW